MDEGRAPSVLFDIGLVEHRLARIDREVIPRTALFRHFALLPPARRFVPNRWFSPWAFRKLYAERYPEIETMSDHEMFDFYLDRHLVAALSPCGVFSEERYRARYPEVAVGIGRGQDRSGFLHYTAAGPGDARVNLPGAAKPPADIPPQLVETAWLLGGQVGFNPITWWFNETFYLSVYPDVHDLVRRAIIKSGMEHFMVEGFAQRRLPSPLFLAYPPAAADLDPWDYLADLSPPAPANPGHLVPLAQACAILRYLVAQGRSGARARITKALWPYVETPSVGGVFDAKHYLAVNIDVAQSIDAAPDAAETHWRKFGRKEHRVAPGTNLFGDRTINFQDVLAWKSGVNFFGPLDSPSGLGHAARGYAAALRAAGVPVDEYDTSWFINRLMPCDLFCSEDLAYSINFICLNADQVEPFAAKYGTEIFNHRANVGAWVWELSAPRPEWKAGLSAFDLIITPSRFCSDSFALFTDCPVRTVPYVVDAEKLRAAADGATDNPWLARLAAEKKSGRKMILFIMDASSYTARKGVDVYCALAARINLAHPGKYLFVLKSHSKDISLQRSNPYGPDILHIDGVFDFPDLCRLKALADLYVSPHRSEGFGLNIIESLLLGVPVLCSDYAGGTDLLAGMSPAPVPVKLAEVGRDMGPYRAEAIWADPDLDAMEAGLLGHFAKPPPARELAALAKRLAGQLAPAAVGAALKRELETYCALNAETAADRLQAFRPIATSRRDECFRLEYVREANRRTKDAPGLERLGEIAMATISPFFSIVTPTYNTEPSWLHELYDDLLHQSYPSWEWCLSDDGSTRPDTLAALRDLRRRDARIKLRIGGPNRGIAAATNAGVAIATGRYLIMIDHDDRVSPDLLANYYPHVRDAEPCIVYCDEDKIDPDGAPRETFHKPDFSPEHLMSAMYVLHCLCIRKSVFLALGGYRSEFDGAQDHDFLLRAAAAQIPIHHIDRLLYHWRMAPSSAAGNADAKTFALEAGRKAVADYLNRIGVPGTVAHGLIPGTYRVRPVLPTDRVALNILTGCARRETPGEATAKPARSNGHDPEPATYIEQFVRSILAHPPELDFEIRVIVDQPVAHLAAPLAQLDARVKIIPFQRAGAHFNFAESANFAISSSGADRNVLLNDDMEALDAEWLPALLEMLELPGVGVAGGRLLFGTGRIQHAGIALGVFGATAHLFEGTMPDEVGYNAYNVIIRNYSAVTGAMMAMRRATFDRLKGFDTEYPIDYNDVDFCLRVNEAGLRVVYTPFAQLRHFESRSARRLMADSLDRHRFCSRWGPQIERDPYYNRNLTRGGILCELATVL